MFWSFLSELTGAAGAATAGATTAGIGQIAADVGKGMLSKAVEGITAPTAGMLNDVGKLTGSQGFAKAGKALSNFPNTLVGRGDIPLKDSELPTALGDPNRRMVALQMSQRYQQQKQQQEEERRLQLEAAARPPLPLARLSGTATRNNMRPRW